MAKLYIIGGGLAGLSAARAAATSGRWGEIHLYEAARHFGGRCRSWHDSRLDRVIDNGNHLILGANRETLAWIRWCGSQSRVRAVDPPAIAFLDLADMRRWSLRPGSAHWPAWLLDPERRVPEAGLRDHLSLLRVPWRHHATVAGACMKLRRAPGGEILWQRLLDPMVRAIMNTPPDEADAPSFGRILRTLLLGGGAAMRPVIARDSLDAALVAPALRALRATGVQLHPGARLRAVRHGGRRISGLTFATGEVVLAPGDCMISAMPAVNASVMLPVDLPTLPTSPIVNIHFAVPPKAKDCQPEFLGLLNGTGEWLFRRRGLVSLTVSAADALVEIPEHTLLRTVWREVAAAIPDLPAHLPPGRVVREKRATMRATPAAMRARPSPLTEMDNLFIAGDWTSTGLPSTIEGALLSGRHAHDHARRSG